MQGKGIDFCCCQGGASKGYTDAGYEMVGVDLEYQGNYPYPFYQADAVAFVYEYGEWIRETFTFAHASPPCQFGSKTQRIQDNCHPNLIPAMREALEWLGLPYVIENVEDVTPHLKNPVMLCGEMFGLRTYRHRMFESGGGLVLPQPEHPQHIAPLAKMGRPALSHEYIHAVGNFSGVSVVREDYAVPWMTRDGIRECIPPVYAEWVGNRIKEM